MATIKRASSKSLYKQATSPSLYATLKKVGRREKRLEQNKKDHSHTRGSKPTHHIHPNTQAKRKTHKTTIKLCTHQPNYLNLCTPTHTN